MTPPPDLPDPIGAVLAMLKADAQVTARVTGRVFGGEVPETENTSMPRACVVIRRAGGGLLGSANQFGDIRMDALCYGATIRDADQVYMAVRDRMKALKSETWDSVLLHWARPSAGGISGRDKLKQWPVTLSSFQVLASEIAAA